MSRTFILWPRPMRAPAAALASTAFLASLATAPTAAADALGTFRWQLQPFCNVVSLSVRSEGGVYTLDGFDDQCGAGERASVVGTAFPNPDGSLGFGWSSVIAPDASPLAVHARLDLSTVNGVWSDSAGNSGTLIFTPGAAIGGPPRPVPSNGIRPGSITREQLAPGAVNSTQIAERAVQAEHLAPGTLTSALGTVSSAQIAPGSIVASHLAPGAVASTAIRDGAVASAEIAIGAVQATHFAPGAVNAALGIVSSAQIALGAVLSSHIAPGAVTRAHIAPSAVGSATIAPGAVLSSHLQPGEVGAAHIAVGAVTASHLVPGLVQSLIVGTCREGQYLRGVTPSGGVICEPFFVPTHSTQVASGATGAMLWASAAVDADSLPIIAGFDVAAGGLRLTKCLNQSCTGDTVSTLPEAAGVMAGDHPSIAIGADGLPIVSHGDFAAGALRVTKCGNAACTAANVSTLADDPDAGSGFKPSIAIGRDGLPVIAHIGANGVRVTKCGDAACAAGNVSTDVSSIFVNAGPAIALGADGSPIISYGGGVNGVAVLLVTKCGNAACSTGNVTTVVDDARPLQVSESAIAVGADGLPIVAYFEYTRSRLRVAKCGNPACTAGNAISVFDDENGQAGPYLSMMLAADGLPMISSQDPSARALRVIKCSNAACSARNIITAVDDAERLVGYWNRIAIGGDGVPVISHIDLLGALRVTKCGTSTCR